MWKQFLLQILGTVLLHYISPASVFPKVECTLVIFKMFLTHKDLPNPRPDTSVFGKTVWWTHSHTVQYTLVLYLQEVTNGYSQTEI
jgi:hypothetical protein